MVEETQFTLSFYIILLSAFRGGIINSELKQTRTNSEFVVSSFGVGCFYLNVP